MFHRHVHTIVTKWLYYIHKECFEIHESKYYSKEVFEKNKLKNIYHFLFRVVVLEIESLKLTNYRLRLRNSFPWVITCDH